MPQECLSKTQANKPQGFAYNVLLHEQSKGRKANKVSITERRDRLWKLLERIVWGHFSETIKSRAAEKLIRRIRSREK